MKKLAIIGASYLQLPLVKKVKEMGIETICFAWEKGVVCKVIANQFYPISIIEKENILKKCQEIGIDGITTIAYGTAGVTNPKIVNVEVTDSEIRNIECCGDRSGCLIYCSDKRELFV